MLAHLIAVASSCHFRAMVVRADARGFKVSGFCRENGQSSEVEFALDGSFLGLFIETTLAADALSSLGWNMREAPVEGVIVFRRSSNAAGRAHAANSIAA